MLNITHNREKEIKTTLRYHLTPVRIPIFKNIQTINAGDDMEKRVPSCTIGGNVNWYKECKGNSSFLSFFFNGTIWRFLKKLGIKLPCDPAILLLNPEKVTTQKDTYITKFIEALFTKTRTWGKSRCSSTDEWIKKFGAYRQWNII